MLPHIVSMLTQGMTIIARGGGGGSGGGGGGSGGGGILFVVGYLPTHAWGIWLRKRLSNPALVIGCLVGTLLAMGFWIFIAAIGLHGWGILMAILALFGGIGGYLGWGEKYLKKIGKAKQEIAIAAQTDPAWDLEVIQQLVQDVFVKFQSDWSTFNVDTMKSYMTERYWQHMALIMAAIKQRERRNDVQDPELLSPPEPIEVQDFSNNNQDEITFLINARAHDVLLENLDGQETELFADNNSFTEYWRFKRQGNTWLLDDILQATEVQWMLRSSIQEFASQNNMFYSKDWGWLLLPRRGVIFSGGCFGRSDINNHVIGVYRDLIIELYTYIPYLNDNNTYTQQYVIAQVALPKRYDSLIVQAKTGGLASLFQRTPSGYNKVSLEWNDFNKRYNVYATNVEQVTAFELLHPVYMEKLFALPFKVSIEVVDNVVYLYSLDTKADYPTMFNLLKDAFEEMKL